MSPDTRAVERLQFLVRVVRKECMHSQSTDQRLFTAPFTSETASRLDADPELAERVEAFASRFGRLRDTLGDKLLPLLLRVPGEKPAAAIDNLDLAERFGLLQSAEEWMAMRRIRNQMVHEYIEDPEILSSALLTAHAFIPALIGTANALIGEAERRGRV